MAKSDDPALDLPRCAEAVDRELRRFEELARNARNIKLSSEKSIVRSARGLQQALAQQERLAEELRAFGQSMEGFQALGLRAKDAVGALVRAIAGAAQAEDFTEIAGDAHALEQRVGAMAERLSELLRAKSIQA